MTFDTVPTLVDVNEVLQDVHFTMRFDVLCKDCNLRSVKKKIERRERERDLTTTPVLTSDGNGDNELSFLCLFFSDTDISEWVEKLGSIYRNLLYKFIAGKKYVIGNGS